MAGPAARREAALGLASGVAVPFVFSGMLVVSRFGALSALTVYDMAGLRFGVAALATLPLLWRLRPRNLTLRPQAEAAP